MWKYGARWTLISVTFTSRKTSSPTRPYIYRVPKSNYYHSSKIHQFGKTFKLYISYLHITKAIQHEYCSGFYFCSSVVLPWNTIQFAISKWEGKFGEKSYRKIWRCIIEHIGITVTCRFGFNRSYLSVRYRVEEKASENYQVVYYKCEPFCSIMLAMNNYLITITSIFCYRYLIANSS